jgi:putative transposase
MTHVSTIVAQVIKLVPRHDFEKLAKVHHSGQRLRKTSRWDQFVALLTSQLTGRQSLRDIESVMRSQRGTLYHLGCKAIARTSLARLNEQQPHTLYEQLFHTLAQRCQSSSPRHSFRFKSPLYSLDSTLIDLSLKLFPWSDHNKHRGAVKLHVGLNHGGHFPAFVAVTGGKVHDVRQGRELNFPRGSIVVFDKGYNDYQWYADMENKGIFFVSRQRTNAVYRVLERKSVDRKSGVTSDQHIELNGTKGIEVGRSTLRRVGYRDPETGKQYVFITNRFDLSAKTIADIYRDRWQIELFFKSIKQNLKIHAFVGNSVNAVMTQIWVALCAYLLACYLKFSCQLGWGVQRILRLLQGSLFAKGSLIDLLRGAPPPDSTAPPQLALAL